MARAARSPKPSTDPETRALLAHLGSRVRALRQRAELSAREVAARARLSVRFYSALEAGVANIAIGRLARVAAALGVALGELVRQQAPRHVVALLGLRGAGKSTIGRELARRMRVEFLELDELIERRAGLTKDAIFDLHGEPYYRRREGEELRAILDRETACVLALPGGIVKSDEAVELLAERAVTVWLRARPEEHMERVRRQGDLRPMANRADAMLELRAILAAREPLYARADLTVETSARSVRAVVAHLARELARAPWPPLLAGPRSSLPQ